MLSGSYAQREPLRYGILCRIVRRQDRPDSTRRAVRRATIAAKACKCMRRELHCAAAQRSSQLAVACSRAARCCQFRPGLRPCGRPGRPSDQRCRRNLGADHDRHRCPKLPAAFSVTLRLLAAATGAICEALYAVAECRVQNMRRRVLHNCRAPAHTLAAGNCAQRKGSGRAIVAGYTARAWNIARTRVRLLLRCVCERQQHRNGRHCARTGATLSP